MFCGYRYCYQSPEASEGRSSPGRGGSSAYQHP